MATSMPLNDSEQSCVFVTTIIQLNIRMRCVFVNMKPSHTVGINQCAVSKICVIKSMIA